MKTQLRKGEKIAVVIRKHWLVLLLPFLWTAFLIVGMVAGYIYFREETEYGYFLIIGATLVALWFTYKFLERKSNLWAVTNFRIIDEYGVFSNNSKETPLDKINNISYRQPFIGRIFNYGDVQIQSAAESGAIVHKMIEKPRVLKETITEYQELYKEHQLLEQVKKLADAVDGEDHSSASDISDELIKLHRLKEKGIITEEDFQAGKNKILGI